MAENHFFKRRMKNTRQKWDPHWSLKLIYGLWSAALAVLKIAIGAAATVLLICVVCGFVFVGILGNYLNEDVLPQAYYNMENANLDQTSFVYYVDDDGNIQLLQQIHTENSPSFHHCKLCGTDSYACRFQTDEYGFCLC